VSAAAGTRLRVGIAGAAGRMGRALISATLAHPALELAAALVRPGSGLIGADAASLIGAPASGVRLGADLAAVLPGVDVLVDFSLPEAALVHLAQCADAGTPVVLGSTGFDRAGTAAVAAAAERIALVHAANYSVGVTLTLRLLALAAEVLGDSVDVEVVEAHHRHKRDAPSGTALRMGETLAAALGRDLDVDAIHGRHGLTGERDRRTIGFSTIRGGDVVGEHTVLFLGDGERLEITHRASSRMTFAQGALRASLWVAARNGPGLYDMDAVLGLAPGAR
jgi:4-hydroxy-tetrahydrodipicolinate reductase